MQQTQTYKLNKPGTDDPIAIAPLNENMEKIEAALTAEAQARQAAVDSEAQTRAAADASEAQARANADAAEIQARQAAVSSEAQARAAADNSEAQARQSADASEAQTRAAAVAALDQRLQVFEARHFVVGSYEGTGATTQDIILGFTPRGVLTQGVGSNHETILALETTHGRDTYGVLTIIIPNGFRVYKGGVNDQTQNKKIYYFVAFD